MLYTFTQLYFLVIIIHARLAYSFLLDAVYQEDVTVREESLLIDDEIIINTNPEVSDIIY